MRSPAERYLTEEAARKIDCPMFKYVVNETDVVQDGRAPIYVHESCRGSGCIMWRWGYTGNDRYSGAGYCGMAGDVTT